MSYPIESRPTAGEGTLEMSKDDVVGVRFQRAGRILYCNANNLELVFNDDVVVETKQGTSLAKVVIAPSQVIECDLSQPLPKLLRKSTSADLQQGEAIKKKEEQAFNTCKKLAAKHNIPLKVVSTECNLEGSHVTVYFAAAEKVEFRRLLKELSSDIKMKVEFKQIGSRDAAKFLGGLGRCGSPLCCSSFLTEFNPVSIKMAKEQNLSLDPMKNSGMCGRLLCCLEYESHYYKLIRERLPKVGQMVSTPMGKAKVVALNPLRETANVRLENDDIVEVLANDLQFEKVVK
ncbi:MAG: regulatory iron-sulfur-containing complex subunit RicT [Chloroflexota bacterium]|nr:regulatory iron-sulfur-containing complex subunit RicT [Chloroflexota bacterium]